MYCPWKEPKTFISIVLILIEVVTKTHFYPQKEEFMYLNENIVPR